MLERHNHEKKFGGGSAVNPPLSERQKSGTVAVYEEEKMLTVYCRKFFIRPIELRIVLKRFGKFISAAVLLSLTAIAASVLYNGCSRKMNGALHQYKTAPAEDAGQTTLVPPALTGEHREWFVAADGKPNGDGTPKSPWNLATALDEKAVRGRIKPGDIVWLRGGIYKGIFTVTIKGTQALPIQVRAAAGERAVLDKNSAERETGALNVRGAHVWFRDFEVTNSYPERRRLDAGGELNPWRGSAINVWAANTKYINLVVHDGGHGFGLWNEDGGTEIYGCILFNNGNNKKEHGVYAHNKNGTQSILDNVIFNGAGYGLHIYANSTKSSISGFDIEGNAIFNNGALTLDDQAADQILVGGVEGVAAERITLRENYIYTEADAATNKNRGIRLGYENKFNKDVGLFDNYIVGKVPLKILWWNSVEARGNTIVSPGASVEIETLAGKNAAGYKLESNVYLNAKDKDAVFILNDEKEDFGKWQRQNNFDRGSRVEPASFVRSAGAKIFIRPNKYESGRANIVVYNWNRDARVAVNLSGVLRAGDKYEVRDVQNYFGEPASSSVYDGKQIQLPMNLSKTTEPTGSVERVPPHTSIEFGVFIVRKK